MSKDSGKPSIRTMSQILDSKQGGRKLSAITCYDSAFARILEETEVDIVLVGDSLGNVILGYENTLPVTLEDMVHHGAAVSRVLTRPFLCIDMPFLSYNLSVEQAVENAGYLVQKGGARAVKVEGGRPIVPMVKGIVEAGIPVMGHLGCTPQSLHKLGGYKVQGRGEAAGRAILEDAKALEEAGVFALVLELVPRELAARITESVSMPTIGIGAGENCDGQIIVLHDILGFDNNFKPRHVKTYANLHNVIKEAVTTYDREVKEGVFPTLENSFSD